MTKLDVDAMLKVKGIKDLASELTIAVNNIEDNVDTLKEKIKMIDENVNKIIENHELESRVKKSSIEKKDNLKDEMAKEISKETKKVIQLKNGQSNQKFIESIDRSLFGIPEKANVYFEGVDGLTWCNEKSMFEGEPKEPGEYIGTMKYWMNIEEEENEKPPIEKEVHFLVNPDPRSLWQNIDPPDNASYYKNNQEYQIIKCGEKKIIGVSVRGKSHAHKGTFRDDHFAIKYWEEKDWVLQVVADGAGTAEFSRKGSEIACEQTVEQIGHIINSEKIEEFEDLLKGYYKDGKNDIDEKIGIVLYEITVGTAFNANKAINKFSNDEGYEIKKYATTLLFALSKKFDFGTIIITFSVGDGAIGVIYGENADMLMIPDGGEYSGQTRFLTMNEIFKPKDPNKIKERYSIKCYNDHVQSIILMTDGVSDPKFGTDNNLNDPRYWGDLWCDLIPILVENEPNEESLYKWMDFYIPGEYDDRTISILY